MCREISQKQTKLSVIWEDFVKFSSQFVRLLVTILINFDNNTIFLRILFIFIFTVGQFNEYVYNIELANKLYDFEIKNKKNKQDQLSKINYQPLPNRLGIKSTQSTPTNYYVEDNSPQISKQSINSPIVVQERLLPFQKQYQNDQIEKTKNFKTLISTNLNKYNQRINQETSLQLNSFQEYVQKQKNTQENNFQDDLTNQRLNSFRPFRQQAFDSKIQNSKQNSKMIRFQQNLDNLQLYKDNQFKDQEQNTKNDIGLSNLKDDNAINDIDQIQSQMNYQLQGSGRKIFSSQLINKPFSKSNYQTLPKFNKGSLLEIHSEGNINYKSEEKEEKMTFINGMQSFRKNKTDRKLLNNKTFLEKELKYIINRDRSLWLDTKYFINKLTCGKLYNTCEVQLLNKAIDLVKQDLDISIILDRQKDIQKFKKLFLTPDQQVLFNFFPKPLINADKDEVLLSRQSIRNEDTKAIIPLKLNNSNIKRLNITLKNLGVISKAVQRFKQNINKSQISNYSELFNCYERIIQNTHSEQYSYICSFKFVLTYHQSNLNKSRKRDQQKVGGTIRFRNEEYF